MLKLRGLPFSTTKEELIGFFSDLPVAPVSPDGCAFTMVLFSRLGLLPSWERLRSDEAASRCLPSSC